jgi:hypothetical protein
MKFIFNRIVQNNLSNVIPTADLFGSRTIDIYLWHECDTTMSTTTRISWKLPSVPGPGEIKRDVYIHNEYFALGTAYHVYVGKRNFVTQNVDNLWDKALKDCGKFRVVTDRYLFM